MKKYLLKYLTTMNERAIGSIIPTLNSAKKDTSSRRFIINPPAEKNKIKLNRVTKNSFIKYLFITQFLIFYFSNFHTKNF